jgi:hypothetical protein
MSLTSVRPWERNHSSAASLLSSEETTLSPVAVLERGCGLLRVSQEPCRLRGGVRGEDDDEGAAASLIVS